MATLESASRDLHELVVLLEDKNKHRRLLKRTLAQEARKVKSKAAQALRKTGVDNAGAMVRNIRAKALRDYSGYIVAANPHGNKSMYKSRRVIKRHGDNGYKGKPVVFWVEVGTKDRRTGRKKTGRKHWRYKNGRRYAVYESAQPGGHSTGSTKAHHYMEAARRELRESEKRIVNTFETNVRKMTDKILTP